MIWDEERRARAGICAVTTVAEADFLALVAKFGPVEVWERLRSRDSRSSKAPWAQRLNMDELIGSTKSVGARFLIPTDDEWPGSLGDLAHLDPVGGLGGVPVGLWVRGPGSLADWAGKSVAIVGSRAATPYGSMVASDLAADLADAGWTVVSGGAYGIDAAAHRGALVEGRTVAVLASGVDELYPRGNKVVLEQVVARGLVVSELAPSQRPDRVGFLARNRLIAALSNATVVVEASRRSGAKNTATWASGLGRPLMAVPGPVTSDTSCTPHALIRDGVATLVTSASDVLSLLGPLGSVPEPDSLGEGRMLDDLSPTELRVREALPGRGNRSAGEVALLTGLDMNTCLATLTELEFRDLVAATSDGRWKISRPKAS